ncbi:DNA polymerase I [Chondromyces apiculatus]|uniref:DNA polymerase I n=1 Tax=Chondromyces apiculatus DSM 436 TaxID=1192034 RepID=A0A017T455_9BACT|nr:DNA polymerase I [Chondromyces apiculatus]EYF04024.1 DNA polymerase I [Chondromyces apiculatus DSM 436]
MSTRPTALPPAGAPDVLYLVDLSGYVFRAFHAISPLTSTSGEPTNATYGTVAMLSKLVEERKPAYLGVAMDAGGKTFRGELDPRYKAHRPPPPPELTTQMARCKEIVEAYRIPIFIAQGLEADDLLAVAVARAKEKGLRVVIASSDKDLMQLVDEERVMLWDAMRDKVYGAAEVKEKFGVPPEQVRDLLALVGDSSDNVPGVPGVGLKTAADLLGQFGTMEALYDRIEEVKKPRIREALKVNKDEALLSQKLVTLDGTAPVDLDLDKLRYGGGVDVDRLREIFTELGFTRFLKAVRAPTPEAREASHRVILSREDLVTFVDEVKRAGRLALEVHASSRDAMFAEVVGISLSCQPGQGVYIPTGHRYLGAPAQLGMEDLSAVLGPVLADPAVSKVGHDLKFCEVALLRRGMKLGGLSFDTMLASYLLDPEGKNDLPGLAERETGLKVPSIDTVAPKRKGQPSRSLDEIEVGDAAKVTAPFPAAALALSDKLRPRLHAERLEKLHDDLELPLSGVLAEMEFVGVLVDPAALTGLGEQMALELTAIEEKAQKIVGHEINLASPKQLEAVLFDELKLKSQRKTKTGRSTDADVLEALADDHPLPAVVLEHRLIAKLKGTYIDALPRLIHPDTGRIHTRWGQAVAATGRISSQDPNLQNIPIRTPLGRSIRRAFVAPPGSVIVSADYSQIELRVLAHLSRDPVLVEAFRTGQDIHTRTAMEIFGVDAASVTDEMRRQSKTINFGVIYGMGETALAKRLGISRTEAARFIDAYFQRYRGVHEFMGRTMAEARRTESVHTLLGRRRLLPELRSSDRMRRAYAERIAQNTPIQGTAADLLKLAMVKLAKPVVPGARMVLTVHDELAFEVPAGAAAEAAAKVRELMETVYPLDVPLVVDVGQGPSWADAH